MDCKNCGEPLQGRYCQRCGQDSRDPPGRLFPLLAYLGSHATGIEARALRSLVTLFLRPGLLTHDYVEGRRARHVGPVQLYLWCTAAFFLLQAYSPFVRLNPDTGAIVSTLSAVSIGTDLSRPMLAALASQGVPLTVFAQRFAVAVSAYLPVLLVGLVFACAGLMSLEFRRESWLVHTTFALHWTGFYLALETLRQLLPFEGPAQVPVSILTNAIAVGYLAIALRVVYQRSWLGSAIRALVTFVVFASLLGGWLWSTSVLAEHLA